MNSCYKQRPKHFPSTWPEPYEGESDAHFHARIAGAYTDIPEAFHLFAVGWEVKGDLTFKYEGASFECRLDMFEAALGRTAKKHRVFYPKLLWAARNEEGKLRGGISHFHFVAAHIRHREWYDVNLNHFCSDLLAQWHQVGGGWAKIEPYAEALSGCGYVCKGPTGDLNGTEPVLTMSKALKKLLRRKIQRHRGA